MKRIITFVSLISVFIFLTISANAAEFWASKNSNKYHHPTCTWAKRINPSNLIKFNSPEEAIKANYIPCKICRPPNSSRVSMEEYFTPQLASLDMGEKEYQRGCCSHHRGVCGCKNGRIVCCDRTYSRSCRCR